MNLVTDENTSLWKIRNLKDTVKYKHYFKKTN